jgi:hypothetical protein
MGRFASHGLQVPLLTSGLFGMQTNSDAFSRRSCLDTCAHCQKVEQQLCLGPFCPEKVSAEWCGTNSIQSRSWAVPSVEGHHWPDPSRRFTGLSEPSSIKKQPAREPLGVSQWRVWDSPYRFSLQLGEVLKELQGGSTGGCLGANKTLDKARLWCYWLHVRSDVSWCQHCDTCTASRGPWTWSQSLMHQYNVRAQLKRITIHHRISFPDSNWGNWYLLLATNSLKLLRVCDTPKQEALTAAYVQVTNFFYSFGIQRVMHSDLGQNFESWPLQEVSVPQKLHEEDHPSTKASGWHGGTTEDSKGTYEEGRFNAPQKSGMTD